MSSVEERLRAELQAAREQLRQSQATLSLVTDNAPVMLVHCDNQRRYTFVNRPYAQRLELEPQEVVGKTIAQVLGAEVYDRIRGQIDAVLAGALVEFELELPYPNIGLRTVHCTYRPAFDEASSVQGFTATILDVTERERAETSLRASEQSYRLLTDALPHMIWTMRPDLTLEYLNRKASEFTGLSSEEVNAGGWARLVHPDDLPGMLTTVTGPLERGEAHQVEYRFRHHTGQYRWVVSNAMPVRNDAGELVKWIGSTLDIHDRWLAERQFRMAVEASPIGVFLADPEGKIVLANSPFERMFGYGRRELLGTPVERLIPERYRTGHPAQRALYFANPQTKAMGGGRDLWGLRKDGSEFPVEIGLKPVPMENDLNVLASVIDISGRRAAEQQLRELNASLEQRVAERTAALQASLHEKEVLLKEIHHRVKNNLQIVSALLDLQSEHTQDPRALEMFQESQGRVKSMALIHERLYRSHDMARVNFAEYVRQLTDDLYRTYKVTDDDIRLELDVEVPPLSIDIAIPCGLLLNELMSNCFKHAFRAASAGHIRVSLRRPERATNVLTIADDGVGFPAQVDFRHTTSFGMQLVNTLVEQLKGSIELTNAQGTTFTVRFPGSKE